MTPDDPELGRGRKPEERWHALLTYPQRERAGRAWLERRGVHAFYPVRRERRVLRGRALIRESRYLPGYLFAFFPGAPVWHELLDSAERPNPFLRDVIRLHDGSPGWLHPDTLAALMSMSDVDAELVERWRNARMLRRGCTVRIRDGALEGREVEVVELGAGLVRVRAKMFGAELQVELGQDRVEFVAAPQAAAS